MVFFEWTKDTTIFRIHSIISHNKHTSLGYGIAFLWGITRPVGFLQLLPVDIDISVNKADLIARQSDHTLDQQLVFIRALENNDITAFRGWVSQKIRKAPAR